ncbi:MAG: HAD hydrolase-like protein [Prolixibacteraceae bacterium]|nr:HAD hydrolase-like protein [Prolixibacteraceae bacterium]
MIKQEVIRKKAIILDLDNTIYPVSSIGDRLFESLFLIILESGEYTGQFEQIRFEIMRRPFQFIADEFSFSESLKADCFKLLANLTYDEKMQPFEGYETLLTIPCKRFLVTTGYTQMQHSKIRQLGIENDFEAIFIIDPDKSGLTKRDLFEKILADYNFSVDDVLVVGDDLNSEILHAKALGIETVLYDYLSQFQESEDQKVIRNHKDLHLYL